MKAHAFLSVVPKPFRIVACAIVCCCVLIGLIGLPQTPGHSTGWPELGRIAGVGMGLLAGSIAGIWVLCLGFVYADARSRSMPPILWTLIAALVPNLLGFLFYFALRRPLASPCPKCGHAIAAEQRFCAWCGNEIASPPSSQTLHQAPGAPS
jgi:fructose-specific phosphotransferase system IIC component